MFNFPVDTLRESIPFDKNELRKRCVGVAGDSLMIIEKDIINGEKLINTENIITQFQYIIQPKDMFMF